MKNTNHTPDPFKSKRPTNERAYYVAWSFVFLLVSLAWVGACSMRGGEKVVLEGWEDGFAAGQSAAQEVDRPMAVFFTAGWCGPCQVFKKKVLTDASVQKKLSAYFVAVQVDLTDNSSSNPALAVAETYGVRGIPTLMVMTPKGEVIASYAGGNDPAVLNTWLDQVSTK